MTDPTSASDWVQGFDVSHYQGTIEWSSIPDDYRFVFIKATDGITYQDPKFADNWAGAAQRKLLRGAYHFFETNDDGNAQADNFLKTVAVSQLDLPPVVDIESNNKGIDAATILDRLQAWLDAVQAQYQAPPMIYTDDSFWNGLNAGTRFSGYPLWIANYTTASQPTLPQGWTSWKFWQHSQNGSIAGISGNVDLNYSSAPRA